MDKRCLEVLPISFKYFNISPAKELKVNTDCFDYAGA